MRYRFLFVLVGFLTGFLVLIGCGEKNPRVVIKTEMGSMIVEIYEKKAPVTAGNFLRLVDRGVYKDASFYRTVTMENQPHNLVKIEVIQGGLLDDERIEKLETIVHETTRKTGIPHKDGVISMARLGPGTASSEFFICVGNQPELDYEGKRNPDGQGFAAFGKIVSGMEVVRKIQVQPEEGQMLTPVIEIMEIIREK